MRSWGDAVVRTNDATRDSGRRGGAARWRLDPANGRALPSRVAGNGVIAYDPADGVRLRLLWRAQRRRAVSLWGWKPNEPISDTTVASSQG